MALLGLDGVLDLSAGVSLAPDGTSPSSALAAAPDPAISRPEGPPPGPVLRLSAAPEALDHRVRWSFPPIDLSAFDQLRLWLRAGRPADGAQGRPFFLELRLGSAALDPAAPQHPWARLLPASQPGSFEQVRLNLRDLPPAIRAATSILQLRCAAAPFAAHLTTPLAVREEPVADAEAALLGLLHNQLSLKGNPVPAAVQVPGVDSPTPTPLIALTLIDLRPRGDLAPAGARRDFTPDGGYSVAPPQAAFDLLYQIDARAGDRAGLTAILEFLLRALSSRRTLIVNDTPAPFELTYLPPADRVGGHRDGSAPLFIRITTLSETGPGARVRPPQAISISAEPVS